MGRERRMEFCVECRHVAEYVLKKKMVSKTIRDREYSFCITTAICSECGAEMSIPGLIDKNVEEIDAQYREMEVFTQFSSDLDEATKKQLVYGQGLMRLLRQPQSHPMKLHEKVITLVAATAHVMQDIKPDDIIKFRQGLLNYFHEEENDICEQLEKSGQMSDETKAEIIEISKKYLEIWQTREK